ncbi:hypothetical protein R6Q59_023716, partial [Mikania micrantha]
MGWVVPISSCVFMALVLLVLSVFWFWLLVSVAAGFWELLVAHGFWLGVRAESPQFFRADGGLAGSSFFWFGLGCCEGCVAFWFFLDLYRGCVYLSWKGCGGASLVHQYFMVFVGLVCFQMVVLGSCQAWPALGGILSDAGGFWGSPYMSVIRLSHSLMALLFP